MRNANYQVVQVDHRGTTVWIEDLDGPVSVTNAAERVVAELLPRFPGYRIIYKDTMGSWDELVHEHGRFKCFRPGLGKMAPSIVS